MTLISRRWRAEAQRREKLGRDSLRREDLRDYSQGQSEWIMRCPHNAYINDWPILEVLTKTLNNLIIYEFYDMIILILEQGEDVISSFLKLLSWDVTLFTI